MTAAKKPSLDPRIAALPVDPESRRSWAWPLVGLIGRYVAGEDVHELAFRLDRVLPQPADVDAEADAIIAACRSKSRAKPGARVTLLLAALAAQGAAVPDVVLLAMAAALGVSKGDLTARSGAVTWLPNPEKTALQIVARVAALRGRKAEQGEERGVRLAVYDLISWYQQQGKITHATAINALAGCVGLVDPVTAEINWNLLGHGHDLRDELRVVDHLAERQITGANRFRAELLNWVRVPQVRETDRFNDRLNERVDQLVVQELQQRSLDVDEFVSTVRRKLRDQSPARIADLADIAGLTNDELLELIDDEPDPVFDKAIELAKPRKPSLDTVASALGIARATVAPLIHAAAPLVEQRLQQADALRRTAEQLRALSPEAFAAYNGRAHGRRLDYPITPALRRLAEALLTDPAASPGVRDDAAKLLGQTSPVGDVSSRRRVRGRPARP